MGICLPIPIPCNHTNIHFTIILHACHNHSCLILHNCVPNNNKSHNLNNCVYPPHNLQDKTKLLYIISLTPTIKHLIMFSMLIFISILHIFPLKWDCKTTTCDQERFYRNILMSTLKRN